MFAAFLTAFLFSISAVCARRIAVSLGALPANTLRLGLAFGILVIIMLAAGTWDTVRPAITWLGISGLIGFGVGDVALYLAIVRIGSRLTTLLVFAIGPLVSASMEFLWLGVGIGWTEVLAIVAILAGLVLVLRPGERKTVGFSAFGVVCGVLAGLGQAIGAVFSRRANTLLDEGSGDILGGLAQAAVRVGGGLPIAIIALIFVSLRKKTGATNSNVPALIAPPRFIPLWILVAALCGPVLGVGCFQWALFGLPSGIVLAVVSLVPIFVMPWSYVLEGDRPSRVALIGTAVAVGGVVMLALAEVES